MDHDLEVIIHDPGDFGNWSLHYPQNARKLGSCNCIHIRRYSRFRQIWANVGDVQLICHVFNWILTNSVPKMRLYGPRFRINYSWSWKYWKLKSQVLPESWTSWKSQFSYVVLSWKYWNYKCLSLFGILEILEISVVLFPGILDVLRSGGRGADRRVGGGPPVATAGLARYTRVSAFAPIEGHLDGVSRRGPAPQH